MAQLAILGFFLTALVVCLIGLEGYLLALWWRTPARRPADGSSERGEEALDLAVRTGLLAVCHPVVLALALGGLGQLRVELALAVETALVYGTYRALTRREPGIDLRAPALRLLRKGWLRLRAYPVLSLVGLHALGTEVVRGLLRPPLSWDSLMYHLYLAAGWLQQGDLGLVAARGPTTAYLFMPANGSLWLWWWMAPSHSELLVNVAYVPAWALLGLATGALARELGARRHWPVAAFLTLLAPVVLRFAATQYVDILMAACLVTASYYLLRWIREPHGWDAVLAGLALGLAVGTKVPGLLFGAALAGIGLMLAAVSPSGRWGRRLRHVALAAVIALALGGFFYTRNAVLGGGLLGYPCVQEGSEAEGVLDNIPAAGSLADLWDDMVAEGFVVDAFLGSTRATLAELGVGPQVVLLLIVALVLPFVLPREHRAGGWLIQGQVAVQLVFWVLVPYADDAHILANVRYLDGAVALLFAGGVALAERHLSDLWIRGLAMALAVQDLLMLRSSMPRGVRWLLAVALLGALALALSSRLRELLERRWRLAAALGAVALLAFVPAWVEFRIRDRERAFEEEYTAHLTTTRMFAEGWGWLDRNAGRGTVAVSHAPENYFVYPAMGPFLERRAVYVHINEAAHDNPLRYPGCNVRVEPSRRAWLRNLRHQGVRWLYVARFPEFDFPLEDRWARELPGLFVLRLDDRLNRVYELAWEGETGPSAQ